MLTRRSLTAAVVFVAGAALAGCGTSGAAPAESGTYRATEQAPAIPYKDPPSRVPKAFFGTQQLAPAQTAWRTPRGFTLGTPREDQDVPQTVITWNSAPTHDVVLRTTVQPTRATVTVFANTKLDATPVGDGNELVCTPDPGSDCIIRVGDRETVFRPRHQVTLPAAVVLGVGYATFLPDDAAVGVTSYSASWAFRAMEGSS